MYNKNVELIVLCVKKMRVTQDKLCLVKEDVFNLGDCEVSPPRASSIPFARLSLSSNAHTYTTRIASARITYTREWNRVRGSKGKEEREFRKWTNN